MKKNIFLSIVIFTFFVTSCSENQDSNIDFLNSKSKKEPELNIDFTISGKTSENKLFGIGTTWTIGRRSLNCRRLGICKLESVTIIIKKSNNINNGKLNENNVFTELQKNNGEYFAIFELDNFLDSSIYDTNFYIDETINNGKIIVNQGIYELDETIGDFGGYKIPVTYNE